MNSKILKLDAPYNIIYAGGRVGRHIATMTVWEDNDMGIYDAHQYAMIDEGGELAAGALAVEAELGDCRVICNESDPRVRLRWLAEIVEYDLRQEEPVEFRYIWERLSLLGVKVIWDKARDETRTMSCSRMTRESISMRMCMRSASPLMVPTNICLLVVTPRQDSISMLAVQWKRFIGSCTTSI